MGTLDRIVVSLACSFTFGMKEMYVGKLLSRCVFYCHRKDQSWLS